MPRTASKASQSRPIPRGRSSAWSTVPSDQPKVPVLFRLPIIEQATLAAGIDEVSTQDAESPSELSPAKSSVPAFDPAEIAVKMQSLSEPVKAEVVVSRPASTQASPSAESQQVEVVASSSSYPARSWWEHWSSGVVLILLVIALVTASIIAFNDSGKIDTEPMADSSSEFALNSIEIPDVQLPTSVTPPASSSAATVELPVESANVESLSIAQATLPASPPAETKDTAIVNAQASKADVSVGEEDQELVLDGFPPPATSADGLIPNTLDLPASEAELALEAPAQGSLPLHSATLMRPVAEQERQLFAPKLETQAGLPAHPVGTQVTEKAKAGGSPSLYDGADVAATRDNVTLPGQTPLPNETTQPSNTSALEQPNVGQPGIVDTNLPTVETLLGNTGVSGPYRQVSQPSGSAQANFAVASHQTTMLQEDTNASTDAPATSSTTGPAAGVVETSTPQSNIDALLLRWQQFKAMSEPGNTSNRYPNN